LDIFHHFYYSQKRGWDFIDMYVARTLTIQQFPKYAPKHYSGNQLDVEIPRAILHIWGKRKMQTSTMT
jgi:hypothetical protein